MNNPNRLPTGWETIHIKNTLFGFPADSDVAVAFVWNGGRFVVAVAICGVVIPHEKPQTTKSPNWEKAHARACARFAGEAEEAAREKARARARASQQHKLLTAAGFIPAQTAENEVVLYQGGDISIFKPKGVEVRPLGSLLKVTFFVTLPD